MNILIISNLYDPFARGGAETVAQTTAEGLVARGHSVSVLTAGPIGSGFWPRETQKKSVRIFRFFPLNIYFVGHDFRFPFLIRLFARWVDLLNIHSAWMLDAFIKKEQPDVVVTHNLVGFGLLTAAVLRRRRMRHIHTLHDVQLIHPSGLLLWGEEEKSERTPSRKAYEFITKCLMGSPVVVISPSKWLLDFHTKRGFFSKSKAVVLENPIASWYPDERVLSPVAPPSVLVDSDELRAAGGPPPPAPPVRLFYAGQLEIHKGVWWLLDVLKEKMKKPEARMVLEIAGAGSLAEEVKSVAASYPSRIFFRGKLLREELFKKFQEVDALVVPSLCYENAPQIIAEALACGLPVVASRIGGIPELVRDGENGFLFTPGNKEEFLSAVTKVDALPGLVGEPMTASRYIDALIALAKQ